MRSSVPSFHRRPTRQRGAAAVFAGIAMVALVAAIALVIDIGQLYFAQQKLQKQANLAALDAARLVARCESNDPPSLAALNARVDESLGRNLLEEPEQVDVFIDFGQIVLDPQTSHRALQETGILEADSVRVSLRRPAPSTLFGGARESRQLTASATAQQAALGSFYLGTSTLSLNGGLLNQVLGGLLCASGDTFCQNNVIALDVASARSGLLALDVTASQLATAVGVSVRDLADPLELSLMTPVLPEVFDGLAGALSGTASATIVNLLQGLGDTAEAYQVALGDVFDSFAAESPDAPVINLGDLLIALAQASRADDSGVSSIFLPINLNVPGVAEVGVFANILEPPKFSGVGRPGELMAESAQVRLGIRINSGAVLTTLTNTLQGLINGLISGLVGALTGIYVNLDIAALPLNIGIDIGVSKSRAYLDSLSCPRNGTNDGMPIAELSASPALATVDIGHFDGSALSAPPLNTPTDSRFELLGLDIDARCAVLCLLNLGSTSLEAALELSYLGVGGSDMPIPLPMSIRDFEREDPEALDLPPWHPAIWRAHGAPDAPPSLDGSNPQTVSSPLMISLNADLPVTQSGTGLLGVLSGLVATVVDAVFNILQPLLDLVNGLVAALVQPLLSILGIQLGTAEVTMHTVTVGQPRLISTEVPVLPQAEG
ncbi:MAG: pilus assembly protein TadG-related protein [Algiphilus sp.]|uniref:pilus assembly protein TadG-related protein n=1 Tax=Algiphilus sp. TaxID=1872431 RepID=UPI0032F00A06